MGPRLVAGITCLLLCAAVAQAQSFDFFYFVVQWPGSYCDLSSACCYPQTGKPASDFSIHGLWPNYDDGGYPSSCDSNDLFQKSQIQDLVPEMNDYWGSLSCPSSDSTSFWSHEWSKHGTCSELADQHDYFSSALALKEGIDFLTPLRSAGITPNGGTYSVSRIQSALASALGGHTPGIECNNDRSGKNQLYQVYICVATDASTLIDCPVFPNGKCQSSVKFPSF